LQGGKVEFDIRLMKDLMPCVEASNVIFAASGSEEILVHAADLEGMSAPDAAVGGMRRFFDISVPRNIDPKIKELEAGGVWNVDDLKEVWDLACPQTRMVCGSRALAVFF
jgi:glutamyl-tRNA reductase